MAKQQSNSKVQVMSEFDVRIQQTSEKLQQIREKEFEIKLERFTMMLNKDAEPSKIMSRRKFTYLPISVLENQLDELFLGRWETVEFKWQQIANEIVGSIQLRVCNPITNEWVQRTGAGAVQIRQLKDTPIADILDKKIKDTLGMDFPHLKSECIKNACKSLGSYFGRNLNRDIVDQYQPVVSHIEAKLVSKLDGLMKAKKEEGKAQKKSTPKSKDNG
jgi:hypothetical protein